MLCLRIFPILAYLLLTACEQKTAAVTEKKISAPNQTLQKEFERWKAKQDPVLIHKYQTYLASKLKNPPDLFALSYNIHLRQPECLAYRFALAPEKQWKNIVKPLQLLEELKEKKLIENYKIVSVYRGEQANLCARGATRSKHLSNYAVDFQVFDLDNKRYKPDDFRIQKNLCDYWLKHGRKMNLGLGTYGQYKFHIDVQGYRTWGGNFKRDTSACLGK